MKLRTKEMTLIAMFTVLAIVGGKISFQFMVVPLTFQVIVALLTGIVLGAKMAFISQLLYLFMGLIGLPVFARGGGITYVFQMSFGYLVGFVGAAWLVGLLTDLADPGRENLRFRHALPIMLAGLAVIYLAGVAHMLLLKNLYTRDGMALLAALQAGVLPFLISDLIWCVLAAVAAPRLRRLSRRYTLTRS
jgi:biotin transport system substrate-specific component